MPIIATLRDLDEKSLVKILKEPKNSLLKQYKRLFEFEDVKLEFRDDALVEIAKKAIDKKTGARGLRSILESILVDFGTEHGSHLKRQLGTKMEPTWDPKPPKSIQLGTKMEPTLDPKLPKSSQDGVHGRQNGAKMAPRWGQDGEKIKEKRQRIKKERWISQRCPS